MGSPVCAASEEGTKAPARSAEMAKRAPDTAPENRWILISTSICDRTSPTETHHGCDDGQDKSILDPFDNTTFAGVTRLTRCSNEFPTHAHIAAVHESVIGTKRTYRAVCYLSAFGAKRTLTEPCFQSGFMSTP